MTKYTIKLLLWGHDKNKKGLYPIYIRITVNRKASYQATGYSVSKKNWDEKNEQVKSIPNSILINAKLVKLKSEWEEKLIKTQLKGIDLSASQLKQSFKKDHTNIFEYVETLVKRGKRSEGTLRNYKKHLKKLEKFTGSRKLNFENINVTFLTNYEAWLRGNVNFRKDEPQKNYVHAIWKTLKTWFNAAKKEGLISHYPFDQYDNPVYVSPDKDYLTVSELRELEKYCDACQDAVLHEVCVYFLFGCYSGLRVSDWMQFNPELHVKAGKLRLRPAKTKNKWVEMVISKPLARNLKRMANTPLILAEPTINEKLKIIASKNGINKHLTTHTGRHTFAVTICLGNKLSSETAAELMGITLSTFVKNYSQVTQLKIDTEAREAWRKMK